MKLKQELDMRIGHNKFYRAAKRLIRMPREFTDDLKRMKPVCNVNQTNYAKNCLMMYITNPFTGKQNEDSHQNVRQAREIARLIGEFGYDVDVLQYDVRYARLNKKYDLVFDICAREKPIYGKALSDSAIKIIYFTGSESVFANQAELSRIQAVMERRGVTLQPRRQAPLISKTVENFDCAILIGNTYNLQTYSGFNLKNVHLVPNTGYDFHFPFLSEKKSSKNFLFFGSGGSVHKGLDLLLEIFSEPGFPASLYVCGLFEQEDDFVAAYRKELYQTPNITPIGFVDIWSDTFRGLAEKCAYTILPSCAEGQAGSITTLMSAGVIPICSRECGFNADEVILLPDCSMDSIRSCVLDCARKPLSWVEAKSAETLSIVRERFSEKAFSQEMQTALESVLKNREIAGV